ncbi:uncharacterized protein LOC112691966 isoform X2 [Sipha flava]|uniref:Uncharacterized protein LOC112691966 isoform X2 n=1 Tax=Sipha flava TaxID=143950 RepID=A0A8B8GI27_9HEMI|nr:uncharacterized protein LOC112691966 isoform X2 [Sipha flava]
MKITAASAATVLVALVASVQSATTKPSTTVTPTRLPVQSSSTPAGQSTTYAKDHAHASTAAGTGAGANATTAATTAHKGHGDTEPTVKPTGAAAHATVTTQKPINMTEGHVALKQKLNTIAVKCKDELHAPQEIMALVSNTVVPQNEQQRCYLECVYKNLNLIKNNKFSVADGKTLAQIRFAKQPDEHKKAVHIIETCEKEAIIDPKTTEKCAAGRVIRNCFVKNGEKINFFPKP